MDRTSCKSSLEIPLSYCKRTLNDIERRKLASSESTEKEIILTLYEGKCSAIIEEIEKNDGGDGNAVSSLLQKIVQFVLDLTFVEECEIVEQDFKGSDACHSLIAIIDELSGLEKLVSVTLPGNQLGNVLGADLVECLHWRRGALLYMYCHTVMNNQGQGDVPAHIPLCLETGVRYLVAMLSVHNTPVWLQVDEQSEKSADLEDEGGQLMSRGIWSDNHLLATMYCGEMCYWHAQLNDHSKKTKMPDSTKDSAESRKTSGDDAANTSNELAKDTQKIILSDAKESGTERQGTDLTNIGDKLTSLHIENTDSLASNTESLTQKGMCGNSSDSEKIIDKSNIVLHSSSLSAPEEEKVNTSTEPSFGQFGSSPVDSLGERRVGKQCMENYIWAAKGPMSLGGWSTDRAEYILQYFESL